MAQITDINSYWSTQHQIIELPNDLAGGTRAMRERGEKYLPKKPAEDKGDYLARLNSAALDNFFKKTVIFYAGQIFQKPVRYQDVAEGIRPEYDVGWFNEFYENVDLTGRNFNIFAKKIFAAGIIDGVTFILTDFSGPKTRKDPQTGRLEYQKGNGEWDIKTAAVDQQYNSRPYFIHIRAAQVMDAWLDIVNGVQVLKHFRYQEIVENPADEHGIDRETVTRIIAWWPNKWEKWETLNGATILIDSGVNNLGVIPISWFMPGDEQPNLTALPPLADLAEINRAYWSACSDHDGRLMPFVRSPAAFGKRLIAPGDDRPIPFSPGRLIHSDDEKAELRSVGVDSASTQNSQNDLAAKRDSMRDFGLQSLTPNITATQSENSAVTASSSLQGWSADLQDCLENSLKTVSAYYGWSDGPALVLNKKFQRGYDAGLLSVLQAAVRDKMIVPEFFVDQLLSMLPYSEEWTVASVLNPDFGKEDIYSFPNLDSFSDEASRGAQPGQEADSRSRDNAQV